MRTTLPEKWMIERNPDNFIVINRWFNEGCDLPNCYTASSGNIGYPNYSTGKGFSVGNHSGQLLLIGNDYEEITFEEFERLVLGKSVQENYYIIH